MKAKHYTAAIEFEKSPGDVFQYLTDVSKWWGGKDFEGQCKQLHDEFIINHPGAHYSKQKLTEVVPVERIVWLVTESKLNWLETNKGEWTNTRMVFELLDKGNKTRLLFTHEGLVPAMECYERCSQGWETVIKDWLFTFITTGKPHFATNDEEN